MGEVRSLGQALPEQMARVRDVVVPAYQSCGQAAGPALVLMRASLDRAAQALATGDVLAILEAYEDLKGYKL